MIKFILTFIIFVMFSSSLFADGHGIPKSGTINWVTGWYFDLPPTQPQADGYSISSGNAIGATFNVNGSGPLHEGRALCSAVAIVGPDVGASNKGNCYFGDKDGDRIYTSFTGDLSKAGGINTIIAGTGKYKGITGTGPWECEFPGEADNGAFNCRQSLTYEIK